MASEYKKRGGSYNTEPSQKDESQKNLSRWNDEDWQTKDGEGQAKQDDGTRKRYLPKKAWEEMDDEEKEKTDEKKVKGSKEGKQFVGNTGKAKGARKEATKGNAKKSNVKEEAEDEDDKEEEEEEEEEEDEEEDDEEEPEEEDEEEDEQEEKEEEKPKAGKKRGRPAKEKKDEAPSKKAKSEPNGKKDSGKKTMGSKHDKADPPAAQASADRLPKKGQTVHWKAMPGWVEGSVVEILTKDKKVEGKQVKASKEDPRIVLKSHGPSGKSAVHKPQAVYFD